MRRGCCALNMRVTVEWATGDLGVLPPIIVVNKLSGRHIETKARRVLVVPQPYTTAIFKYQICNFGLLSVKKERLQRKLSSLEAHRAQRRHSTC